MLRASAICPTFNRPALVCEAVYWFTQQTWGNKELIVLNDNPRMLLFTHVPNVVIYNERVRFPTLGEKYNELIHLATGDVIFPWEDDDISLPLRIQQGLTAMGTYAYWNPRRTWYEDSRGLHHEHQHGYCVNASCFLKSFAQRVPFRPVTGNQDADWWTRAHDECNPNQLENCKNWQYVYRWGVTEHLSGHKHMQQAYDSAYQVEGEFEIKATKGEDYATLCDLHARGVAAGN
jgi:hypothetical protein